MAGDLAAASSDVICLSDSDAAVEVSQEVGRSITLEPSLSLGERVVRSKEAQAEKAGKGKGKSRLAGGSGIGGGAGEKLASRPGKKRKQKEEGTAEVPEPKKAKRAAKAKPVKRVDASGRTVRFSQEPSKEARERIERALPGSGHRLYLISSSETQQDAAGTLSREFKVLGNTQNVYTVRVGQHPSCDCPDATKKRRLCKHHYFVMLRVLRLNRDDPAVWQRALLPAEAAQVLGQGETLAASSDVLANPRVQQAYAAATSPQGDAKGERGRRAIEGDCPICFDELESREQAKICWCRQCGNNVHAACLEKWTAHQAAPTCVICRAPWPRAAPGMPSAPYINLGHAAGTERAPQSIAELYGEESAMWINRSLKREPDGSYLWFGSIMCPTERVRPAAARGRGRGVKLQ